ncbi:MAG TPA: hypothetical protein PK854_12190 [Oscillospiraceae bacterium]|nr:hypothetical protein [Oscillospiraceae bacterium]HPS36010.1 hypothetical protein [Oscillospiraceae bacterium]
MEKHISLRLFLVVIFVFIGAAVLIAKPLMRSGKAPVYKMNNTSAVSAAGVVTIQEEATATAVPADSGENNRWILLAIAVTVINLAGSVAIIFITSKETSKA